MLTSRKARPLDRTIGLLRDARLIIIATEGEKTEEQYFSIFNDTRVQVRVLPSKNGKSSPKHVMENALEFKEDFDLDGDDELWIAIDVDNWPAKALSKIARLAITKKIGLAISNPCFETWLALHFDVDLPDPCTPATLEAHLRQCLGSYNKSNLQLDHFRSRVKVALAKAKALDVRTNERWPKQPGSRIYRLVASITRVR
jgi:hypothetical protein